MVCPPHHQFFSWIEQAEAMPAREASTYRFSARRAVEPSPLQLHPKTVSQLCRWGHILLLPQLDQLAAFQLAHRNMHFLCANLIVKQTVSLARSNAFQGHQNCAESMLWCQFISSNASSLVAYPLPSFLNPSPAPHTLIIICSTVPSVSPTIVPRSHIAAASNDPSLRNRVNRKLKVQFSILVHPIAPIRNTVLIKARVLAGTTHGPIRAQKCGGFPVPGTGCFEQKQPVALHLLQIKQELFYSVAINTSEFVKSPIMGT